MKKYTGIMLSLFVFYVVMLKRISADSNSILQDVDNQPNAASEYKNVKETRDLIYTNANTFFRDGVIPFYAPFKKVLLTPNDKDYVQETYQIYKLQGGLQTIPYMLPIAENIITEIIDPTYQNKVNTFKEQEGPKSDDGEITVLCRGKRAQIPSPNSCSGFVNCWDTISVEQECTKGLLFSERGFCDFPHKVDCGKRPIKSQPSSCVDEFSAYRDPADCSQFSVCVHGEPVLFKCPHNTQYNEKLGVCDYPYKVRCDTSGVGVSSSTASPQPSTAAPAHLRSPAALGATSAATGRMIPFTAASREDAVRIIEEDLQQHEHALGSRYSDQYSPYVI